MSDFSTAKLGEIGKVSMCKRVLKSQTTDEGGIPFFKISTFGGMPSAYIPKTLFDDFKERFSYPKKGDILISAAGTLGKTVIYDGSPAYFQDSNIVWVDNDESIVLNSYLYYFYQTKPWQTTNGSTINRIYNNDLRSIVITYPSLNGQQKVAKVLGDIDKKIELNNKINAELEAMAKLIYDYWFIQFDFPDANAKPYKSSGGKMVYNEVLKREIPDGWEVTELDEVAKCIMGQSPKGNTYNKNGVGIPLLNGPADYKNGALFGSTHTTSPARVCEKNDLVLCIRATIGNLVYSEYRYCLGRGVAAVRPKKVQDSELIYFLILQEIKRFKMQATGSIIKGITKDDLTKSKCLTPPKNIGLMFHNLINPMFAKLRKNKEETLVLIELRDWLLPMLMNGQVTVKDSSSV